MECGWDQPTCKIIVTGKCNHDDYIVANLIVNMHGDK